MTSTGAQSNAFSAGRCGQTLCRWARRGLQAPAKVGRTHRPGGGTGGYGAAPCAAARPGCKAGDLSGSAHAMRTYRCWLRPSALTPGKRRVAELGDQFLEEPKGGDWKSKECADRHVLASGRVDAAGRVRLRPCWCGGKGAALGALIRREGCGCGRGDVAGRVRVQSNRIVAAGMQVQAVKPRLGLIGAYVARPAEKSGPVQKPQQHVNGVCCAALGAARGPQDTSAPPLGRALRLLISVTAPRCARAWMQAGKACHRGCFHRLL